MTTTPAIVTVSSISRIPSTAAWSAAFLSPRPTQRPAPIAAASVTRTSSSARLRSGIAPERRLLVNGARRACSRAQIAAHIRSGASTPIRSRQRAITVCVARQSAEAERLRVALEHAVLVVEAVEVVGDADRVGRDRVRPAALGGLRDDARELGQPLDQLALLGREPARRSDRVDLARSPRCGGSPRSGRARTGRSRPGSSASSPRRGRRRSRSSGRGRG